MQQLKSELTKAIPQKIPEALADFDQIPNSAYIRLPIVMRLYCVSAATIWRGVKNGTIPKPCKLTERTTAWNVGLVRADLAAKALSC
ncbi:MAG: AlpA family phage regulatory protein [Methylotenera sp.]|nr:AlpA family phage regulatory protein [Methylotenera sp.]